MNGPRRLPRLSEIEAELEKAGIGKMLAEIVDDRVHFQVISNQSRTVDSGFVLRHIEKDAPANAPPSTVTVPDKPAPK